ncbi:hypothetical protein [Brevibacterium luteolum]|uniref:hypothetical protein n=1 Tax=Brevibacterium luteolum TaxID=199591 RepID=UPI00223B37AD|nr:hypothetical protein [Brevibacterium luteolum]MCT1828793.1 hypothetical protein [Brevibacterium luteolum]
MSDTPAGAPEPDETHSADESHSADEAVRPAEIRAGQSARGAWMFARGAAAFIFGIVTVFFPREQIGGPAQLALRVDTADYLLIGYLVVQGLLILGFARAVTTSVRTPVLGQAVIVIPAIIFLFLAEQPGQLRAAVAVWALLHAACELWLWSLVRSLPSSSDFLIVGGIHALIGIIIAFGDDMGALTVIGFTGAAMLASGVLYMLGGYSRRSQARRTTASGPATDPAANPDA